MENIFRTLASLLLFSTVAAQADNNQLSHMEKLESLRNQVLHSQRILDATAYSTPADYSPFRRFQANVAVHQHDLAGSPLDWIYQAVCKLIAGNQIDSRLVQMMNDYQCLMAGLKGDAFVELDASLPQTIKLLNCDLMAKYNRCVNQFLSNGEAIDNDYLETARQISSNGRITDSQHFSQTPNPRNN